MMNRAEYSMRSLGISILRSLRVLRYIPEHQALSALDIYRNYVAAASDNHLLHHLSHRAYLLKGLSCKQRVQFLLTHYQFEESTFTSTYRRKVYLEDGLRLWSREACGSQFHLLLSMAPRHTGEGELVISLMCDGQPLHYLGFNWIDGSVFCVPGAIVPFLVRNQGRGVDSDVSFATFEAAFPNNSPRFFCFSALQGIALTLNMMVVLGAKSECHPTFARTAFASEHAAHLANIYDEFWKALGGIELPSEAYLIELPFYRRSLAEVKSKRRKRTAARRIFWEEISCSASNALNPTILR